MHCSFQEGESAFVLSIPHDGDITFPGRPIRGEVERWDGDSRDVQTKAFGDSVRLCLERMGHRPSVIEMSIHRAHLDVNRAPEREPYRDEEFAEDYRRFHLFLRRAIARAVEIAGYAVLLDVHGFIFSPGPEMYDVVLGSDNHKTCPRGIDEWLWRRIRDAGFRAVFSPDASERVTSRYRGGWIVRSSAALWRGWPVDACQIELSPHLRIAADRKSAARRRLLAESIGNALIEATSIREHRGA